MSLISIAYWNDVFGHRQNQDPNTPSPRSSTSPAAPSPGVSMQSRRTLTLTLSLSKGRGKPFGGTVAESPKAIRDKCVLALLSPLGAGRGILVRGASACILAA